MYFLFFAEKNVANHFTDNVNNSPGRVKKESGKKIEKLSQNQIYMSI
jgi:hypothetical protein